MKEDFVPRKVWKGQDYDLWQVDISNLSLSELIELRNDLSGCHDISVRVLDGILYQEYKNDGTYVQRCKKEIKEEKMRIRRKQIKNNKKKWRNKNDKY